MLFFIVILVQTFAADIAGVAKDLNSKQDSLLQQIRSHTVEQDFGEVKIVMKKIQMKPIEQAQQVKTQPLKQNITATDTKTLKQQADEQIQQLMTYVPSNQSTITGGRVFEMPQQPKSDILNKFYAQDNNKQQSKQDEESSEEAEVTEDDDISNEKVEIQPDSNKAELEYDQILVALTKLDSDSQKDGLEFIFKKRQMNSMRMDQILEMVSEHQIQISFEQLHQLAQKYKYIPMLESAVKAKLSATSFVQTSQQQQQLEVSENESESEQMYEIDNNDYDEIMPTHVQVDDDFNMDDIIDDIVDVGDIENWDESEEESSSESESSLDLDELDEIEDALELVEFQMPQDDVEVYDDDDQYPQDDQYDQYDEQDEDIDESDWDEDLEQDEQIEDIPTVVSIPKQVDAPTSVQPPNRQQESKMVKDESKDLWDKQKQPFHQEPNNEASNQKQPPSQPQQYTNKDVDLENPILKTQEGLSNMVKQDSDDQWKQQAAANKDQSLDNSQESSKEQPATYNERDKQIYEDQVKQAAQQPKVQSQQQSNDYPNTQPYTQPQEQQQQNQSSSSQQQQLSESKLSKESDQVQGQQSQQLDESTQQQPVQSAQSAQLPESPLQSQPPIQQGQQSVSDQKITIEDQSDKLDQPLLVPQGQKDQQQDQQIFPNQPPSTDQLKQQTQQTEQQIKDDQLTKESDIASSQQIDQAKQLQNQLREDLQGKPIENATKPIGSQSHDDMVAQAKQDYYEQVVGIGDEKDSQTQPNSDISSNNKQQTYDQTKLKDWSELLKDQPQQGADKLNKPDDQSGEPLVKPTEASQSTVQPQQSGQPAQTEQSTGQPQQSSQTQQTGQTTQQPQQTGQTQQTGQSTEQPQQTGQPQQSEQSTGQPQQSADKPQTPQDQSQQSVDKQQTQDQPVKDAILPSEQPSEQSVVQSEQAKQDEMDQLDKLSDEDQKSNDANVSIEEYPLDEKQAVNQEIGEEIVESGQLEAEEVYMDPEAFLKHEEPVVVSTKIDAPIPNRRPPKKVENDRKEDIHHVKVNDPNDDIFIISALASTKKHNVYDFKDYHQETVEDQYYTLEDQVKEDGAEQEEEYIEQEVPLQLEEEQQDGGQQDEIQQDEGLQELEQEQEQEDEYLQQANEQEEQEVIEQEQKEQIEQDEQDIQEQPQQSHEQQPIGHGSFVQMHLSNPLNGALVQDMSMKKYQCGDRYYGPHQNARKFACYCSSQIYLLDEETWYLAGIIEHYKQYEQTFEKIKKSVPLTYVGVSDTQACWASEHNQPIIINDFIQNLGYKTDVQNRFVKLPKIVQLEYFQLKQSQGIYSEFTLQVSSDDQQVIAQGVTFTQIKAEMHENSLLMKYEGSIRIRTQQLPFILTNKYGDIREDIIQINVTLPQDELISLSLCEQVLNEDVAQQLKTYLRFRQGQLKITVRVHISDNNFEISYTIQS